MRMPKLPPDAGDYGVRDNMFNIGVDMPDIDTEILDYDAETIRQFAACMEAGWRKEAMRIRQNEKPRIKHEVDCDAYAFYSCKTWPKANQAEKQAAKWAEWSEKHAPVTKTV